eukprot:jgi/Chlat1/840/Chrsp104S01287
MTATLLAPASAAAATAPATTLLLSAPHSAASASAITRVGGGRRKVQQGRSAHVEQQQLCRSSRRLQAGGAGLGHPATAHVCSSSTRLSARCTLTATAAEAGHGVAHPKDGLKLSSELPLLTPEQGGNLDVVVAGCGPAGLAVAERASAAGLRVVLVDPAPLSLWPNNYGVWVDEFVELGLEDCLDVIWPRASVFLEENDRRELRRPYGRVDRPKLKQQLLQRCIENGVLFFKAKVDSVAHSEGSSDITCSDGTVLRTIAVLDATGHSRRLVEFDEPFDPGFQAAYGIMAEVESHPFDLDAMLFMDWRDSHLRDHPELHKYNEQLPTFLYAMPFSKTKIFLEETSLVARPPVPFDTLKERLDLRLKHLGITVKAIEESEYCLIPMGGVLPKIPQRVLGIGGTAGLVHPSTGYMISRTLSAAPALADALVVQLLEQKRRAAASSQQTADTAVDPSVISSTVWRSLWPLSRLRQREFFTFGMDVLLQLDLKGTREFFKSFFSLSDFHWQGFLSSRLSITELIGFGLSLFVHASNTARLNLMVKGLPGLLKMAKELSTLR